MVIYREPFCYSILENFLFISETVRYGSSLGGYPKWRRHLVCAKSIVSRSLVSLGLLYYDNYYKSFFVVLYLVTT